MDIEFNFINRSDNSNDLCVVIIQRNVATTYFLDERAIAWRVILEQPPETPDTVTHLQ